MRSAVVTLLLLWASAAVSLERGEWVKVSGGSWRPDAAALSAAKTRIHDRWLEYWHGDSDGFSWDRYSFQYQGVTSASGQRVVHVNAFCADAETFNAHATFDYAHQWLRAFGGGPCFFRADFDPSTNSVTNFQVNANK